MNKNLLLIPIIILSFLPGTSFSQSEFCGFDDVRQSDYEKDSALYVQKHAAFIAMVNRFREQNLNPLNISSPGGGSALQGNGCKEVKYILPVVVHVISDPNDTSTNISDAQINNAIDELNKAFRNDAGNSLPGVNTDIQFCLAHRDMSGNPISGITRDTSRYTVHTKQNYLSLTSLNYFPTNSYINIYVVKDIRDTSGSPSNILGYSTYPNRGREYEYIVVKYNWFGNYNAKGWPLNSTARGLVLTHEMGHYLGLLHPFEKGCVGTDTSNCSKQGDLCCDVPPVSSQNPSCVPTNSCTETNNKPDQKENYMDYSPETCRTIFTADQTSIMHAVLENWRSELSSPFNINFTKPNCCYVSSRFDGINFGCKNDSLTFTAIEYSDTAHYIWKIYKNGSVYRTFSDSIRNTWSLIITDTGRYDVGLVVNSGSRSSFTLKKFYLTIADCALPLQHTNGNWYFGKYAGIKFRTNAVIRDIGPYNFRKPYQIFTNEGSLSMSSTKGQMLFYGGSDTGYNSPRFRIYGKDYKQLVGSPIYGDYTANQAGIIIPFQKDTNKYHIFTVIGPNFKNIQSGLDNRYFHSIIDMGRKTITPGEVTTKNEILLDSIGNQIYSSSESVNSIPKCNNKGHWLLFMGLSPATGYQEKLFVFKVDSSGYSFYKTANIKSGSSSEVGMKVSQDGTLISINTFLYLFDRSNATFRLLNSDSSANLSHVYGSSFSPDSKKLFRIEYYNLSAYVFDQTLAHRFYLYQYDPYSADKFMSKSFVKELPYHRQLQLGPDNKIYLSAMDQGFISNISNPNTRNTSTHKSQFNEVAVELSRNGIGGLSQFGLPNFSDALPVTQVAREINIRPVACSTFEFFPTECCASTFKWVFGDGDSVISKYATHTYSDTGNYLIILRTPGYNITKILHVGIGDLKPKVYGDTLICDTSYNFEYSADFFDDASYKWSGTNYKSIIPDQDRVNIKWSGSGTVKLILINTLTGCKDSTYLNISINTVPQNNTIQDTVIICDSTNTTSMIGSTPTNITGTFSYKWYYISKTGTLISIDTATRKNFNPNKIPYSTKLVRQIVKSNCNNYSNLSVFINLLKSNTISLSRSPCFKGTSFMVDGQNVYTTLSPTINWQYSTDGISWTNYNVTTQNLNKVLSQDSVYIRRLVNYPGYCEVSSNTLKILPNVSIITQPQNAKACINGDAASFMIEAKNRTGLPIYATIYAKFRNASNGSYTSNWILHWPHSEESSNYLFTYKQTLTRSNITIGDSVMFEITTPCGYLISNKVMFITDTTHTAISLHPRNRSKNENDTVILHGDIVGSDPYVRYRWQLKSGTDDYVTIEGYPATSNSVKDLVITLNDYCKAGLYRFVSMGACATYSNPAQVTMIKMSDLWMKDSPVDTGGEPNRTVGSKSNYQLRTIRIFKSPDLYNCQNDSLCTTHQDAEYKRLSPNWAHYTVRNKGSVATKPAKLFLYWTLPSTGEIWKNAWEYDLVYNGFYNSDSGASYPTGGQINKIVGGAPKGIPIPSLAPGDSFKASYPWYPPNPAWYFYKRAGENKYDKSIQICLLARIEYCDVYPHKMSFDELLSHSVDTNVINNNNIVTHNLWVSNTNPQNMKGNPRRPVWTSIAQPANDTRPIDLRFDALNPAYFINGTVIATLDDALWEAWVEGGSLGGGYMPLDSQRLQITDPEAWLSNIISDSSNIGSLGLEFFPPDTLDMPNGISEFTLSQIGSVELEYMGGTVFQVEFIEAYNTEEEGGGDALLAKVKPQEKGKVYLVYPNPANTRLNIYITTGCTTFHNIELTDLSGKILIRDTCNLKQGGSCTKQLDISNIAAGSYLVRLSSENNKVVKKINILR